MVVEKDEVMVIVAGMVDVDVGVMVMVMVGVGVVNPSKIFSRSY